MTEIPAKKFAGAMMILLPILFWITMYIRFDCAGGSCSLGFNWLIVGFFVILFGLFVLLSVGNEQPKKQIVDEEEPVQEDKNARKKKKM